MSKASNVSERSIGRGSSIFLETFENGAAPLM
jgi:hypothetical protein